MARKSKSKFRDRVRANAKHQKESRSAYGYLSLPQGVRMYSAKPGRARLDILPYIVSDPNHPDKDEEIGAAVVGEEWYRRPFRTHRNVGPDTETVVCLSSIGKRCPVCEYRAKMMKEGADKKDTDALKTSNRSIYCVTPIGDREYDEEPHIWDMSDYLFQNLLNDEIEEDETYADFPDPECGYTLKIRFDESSFAGNKFAEASRIDFVERDQPYREKELKKVPDLDKVLNIMTYEKLEKLFLGVDDEEEEEEEERPARRRRRGESEDEERETPRRRSRSADREEDEEEEEQPRRRRSRRASRDEEEEEQPSRRRRRTSRPEPEEEEEDPEPDPAPRRSRRQAAPPKKDEQEEEEDPARRRRGNEKTAANEECPSGYKFGVDTDEYDECDNCSIWEQCIDAKEQRVSR